LELQKTEQKLSLSLQLKGTGTKYSDFTWQTIRMELSIVGNLFDCKIPLVAPSNVVASNMRRNNLILGCSNWSGIIRNLQWYYFGSSNDKQ
jgi:hypothetical protein